MNSDRASFELPGSECVHLSQGVKSFQQTFSHKNIIYYEKNEAIHKINTNEIIIEVWF
jgi:hypothetical protein